MNERNTGCMMSDVTM